MLFSDQRRHALSIPAVNKDGKPATIAFLINYLCENTMRDSRKELFVLDGHLYVLESHYPRAVPILGHIFISASPGSLFLLFSPQYCLSYASRISPLWSLSQNLR